METFNSAMVERNQNIFSNIRLWDWRALDSVYKQFQEIRLYYEFNDVDIDRYTFADAYREVMVSAREMEINNLPEQSQTFVNRRFKYTHGYGITMNNVSEFTPQGLPNLLIRDIPPKSSYPELKVERPEIYYGELSQSPAVVNTSEEEFDYPKGEQNAYIHYPGTGGVPLTSLWRKFIYGWMYDGTRFFLSNYPNQDSRFMFHRQIRERVQTLAPFLEFDQDPYIVMANGRLYWIIDAYTTSEKYPYSENFSAQTFNLASKRQVRQMPRALDRNQLLGMNYLRNSVKAVVNAFSGEVNFYIFDKEDPLIRTWDNIFPGLFQAREAMPEELQAHVRYPDQMLLVQGMVYAKYHMTDKFPKEKRILGPQQVETKIDQDSYLSGQLTLWDQRGSNVIRGNVLAIPIEKTLIYVEPIYLQAETAAYPELRLVVIMHNDRLSYAETFDKALDQLLESGKPSEEALPAIQPGTGNIEQLVEQANQAFQNYLRLQGDMKFEQASKELKKLHTSLQQLMRRTGKE